jgi:hypothetical protein
LILFSLIVIRSGILVPTAEPSTFSISIPQKNKSQNSSKKLSEKNKSCGPGNFRLNTSAKPLPFPKSAPYVDLVFPFGQLLAARSLRGRKMDAVTADELRNQDAIVKHYISMGDPAAPDEQAESPSGAW